MASVSRPYRLVNPGRRKKRNAGKRLTLRQKLFFGSKRQRSAAKASLGRKKYTKAGSLRSGWVYNKGRKRNTHYLGKAGSLKSLGGKRGYVYTNKGKKRRNVRYVRALGTNYSVIRPGQRVASGGTKPGYLYTNPGRKKRKRNVGSILTVLPGLNPGTKNKLVIINRGRKRRNVAKGSGRVISGYGSTVMNGKRRNMARRKRRNSLFGRRRRRVNVYHRRRNPVVRHRRRVARRRHHNPVVRRYGRRRNPGFLSGTPGKIVGMIGGAYITDLLTGVLASQISAVGSGIPLYIAGALVAFLQGKLVGKVMKDSNLGDNMAVGGYTYVALKVLHDFVPSIPNPFGMSGMGLLTSSNNWGPPWVNAPGSMTKFVRPGGAVAAFPAPIAVSTGGMHGLGRMRRGGRLA